MDHRVGWWITVDCSKGQPRTVGEDPAIFSTALETLAVKAFDDMGQRAPTIDLGPVHSGS